MVGVSSVKALVMSPPSTGPVLRSKSLRWTPFRAVRRIDLKRTAMVLLPYFCNQIAMFIDLS